MRILKKLAFLVSMGALLASVFLTTVIVINALKKPEDKPWASVTITNLAGNSGGSGAIIYSSQSFTKVLTNKHVCELLKKGGMVTSLTKEAMPLFFQESNMHDLCLVTVPGNLGPASNIATSEPDLFEDASVIGHPQLMPVIYTAGKFSQKVDISVLIGMRPCNPEELADPLVRNVCMLLNGIPITRKYEAQVVSALIQPGSSGSPVYNASGEIASVVFAGSGPMAFAYAVPFNYVRLFLDIELNTLEKQIPGFTVGDTSLVPSNNNKIKGGILVDESKIEEIEKQCQNNNLTKQQKEFCDYILDALRNESMVFKK